MTQTVASVACALYWFHPLVWVAARQLRREGEQACDNQVLRAGAGAADYAENLLRVAQALHRPAVASLAAVAMTGSSPLEQRLRAILDPALSRGRLGRVAVAAAVVVAACVAVPLAAARAAGQATAQVGKDGVTAPRLIYKVDPRYTEEAKAAKIEGTVELGFEVGVDGRAHDIRVLGSLDLGLDENAVTAVRQWRFEPGAKDGKPVSVRARATVNFRLF